MGPQVSSRDVPGELLQVAGVVGGLLGELGLHVGGAAVAGGIGGWAVKKALKVVSVLVGLELALLAYLQHQGFLTVRWSELGRAITGVATSVPATIPTWWSVVSSLGVGAGFLGGALLGFKRG